ncbi:MAG: sporadic carbohydrate cluster 2OG-Fe(II) oxygenase [Burkholderiaceae bacterium]
MDNNTGSFKKGFVVVDADEPIHLDTLRSQIFSITKEVFGLPDTAPEQGLNEFHKSVTGIPLGQLNTLRVELIHRITAECDVRELVFQAFEKQLTKMLGPDILAQKNTNLVLQPPGDPNPSELHRDSPANSPYELVVWVPLVDCYGTKAMYLLDVDSTQQAFSYLSANPEDWTGFENYAKSLSVTPDVPFGKALIFHTGCLHGSNINAEKETRVSLNIRYKNLFSPSGLKNQLQFFSPLRVSDVARLGSLQEARDLLK